MSQIYRCKAGTGPVISADDITDPMIISKEMAAARGKRFLSDRNQGGYYGNSIYSQKVPHKTALALPGEWIEESVAKLDLSMKKLKVEKYRIVGVPAGAVAEVVCFSSEVPAKVGG